MKTFFLLLSTLYNKIVSIFYIICIVIIKEFINAKKVNDVNLGMMLSFRDAQYIRQYWTLNCACFVLHKDFKVNL